MKYLICFTVLYLLLGGLYFARSLNSEFMIYIGVIVIIMGIVWVMHKTVQFPMWLLWLFSIWGMMHVLGGAVTTPDGVLFSYRILPLIDAGGDLYILKYDQVVHGYLYGVVALMAQHVLASGIAKNAWSLLVVMAAVLVSLGISGLNEIMEFFISLTLENGVGGYDNTMLDMCFNLGGAIVALLIARLWKYRM